MSMKKALLNHETGSRVGIRTDANDEIAMGHVMRCITIAGQLKRLGQSPLFFTADRYAHDLLEQAGMDYICLDMPWQRMEEETDKLRQELVRTGCTRLLVDSYQATPEYFDRIGDICKIIYIDDCFESIYPVDMVINYNAYYVRFPYKQAYGERAKLLLGTEYVPLREEFQRAGLSGGDESRSGQRDMEDGRWRLESGQKGGRQQDEAGEEKEVRQTRIFLSSGGGDMCDALSGILLSASEEKMLEGAVFHVVVGKFNGNKEKLEDMAKQNPNIRLHYNVSHMAELMGRCDLAVSAAGTVLFELSAMQVPSVFFVSADNQQYDSEFFAREERMLFAGDIRENREGCLEEIMEGIKTLISDMPMRERMKKALRRVTDGQGAARIAEEISRL